MIHATAESFSDYVGDTFDLHTDDGVITLTLDNIKLHDEKYMRDNHLEIQGVVYPPRRPFSLTFIGPLDPVLAASMHPLKHATLGELELFLSAFQKDQDGVLYESILN
ncbi:MAG: hypothetical protein ABJN69_16955 [Hellea sp.]